MFLLGRRANSHSGMEDERKLSAMSPAKVSRAPAELDIDLLSPYDPERQNARSFHQQGRSDGCRAIDPEAGIPGRGSHEMLVSPRQLEVWG